MSIYSDLRDEVDSLREALHKRDNHIAKLEQTLANAMRCNEDTVKTYSRLAKETNDNLEKLEFASRAHGILEANLNIRRFIEESKNEHYPNDL